MLNHFCRRNSEGKPTITYFFAAVGLAPCSYYVPQNFPSFTTKSKYFSCVMRDFSLGTAELACFITQNCKFLALLQPVTIY